MLAASPATLDVAAVRDALNAEGLDGWLLYDFRGINPIAADVTGRRPAGRSPRDPTLVLPDSGQRRATQGWCMRSNRRRWLICPARPSAMRDASSSKAGLKQLLARHQRRAVAMEYSPGLRDSLHRARRCRARSSSCGSWASRSSRPADLVQRFAAVWHDAEILTHHAASVKLYRIKDRAFDAIARRMRDRRGRRPSTTSSS